MNELRCHDCGAALPEDGEVWLAPGDGHPDEVDGEPFCGACAAPLGIAA